MPTCNEVVPYKNGCQEIKREKNLGCVSLHADEVCRKLLARSPTGDIKINDIPVKCLLDTRAEASLLSAEFYRNHFSGTVGKLKPIGTLLRLVGANDLEIPVQGYLDVCLEAFRQRFNASILVSKDRKTPEGTAQHRHCPVLLGCNILQQIATRLGHLGKVQLDPDWEIALRWLKCSSQVPVATTKANSVGVFTGEWAVIPPDTVMLF